MAERSIYERTDAIDADLDPTEALKGAPPVWGEKCTGLADKIRRVIVNWRRGRLSYERIPGAVIEVPILDKEDAGATSTDNRFSEPSKWGRELADRAWAFALEHAEKNGPVIDAQLVLEHWDEKKGKFRPLAGGVSAKNCPGTHAGMHNRDDLGANVHDRVIDKLLEAIDRRDMRVERMADKIASVAGGIEKLTDSCFKASSNAITLANSVSAGAAAEKQADRDFAMKLVQMQTMGETIQASVKEVAPHLSGLFDGTANASNSYATLASKLLKSITDDQRSKIREAGLSELVEDMEKVLTELASGKTEQESKALLMAIAPAIQNNHLTLRPVLTEQQQGMILALFKLAGFLP